MTVGELISKLKRYDANQEVCLLDHRVEEAFLTEISIIRKAKKRETDDGCFDDPVVID